MNKKYTNKVNRMKNTRLGKFVCRFMGEEQGAVMMEYVIVAVMIAAAVALGAWFFGAQILGMFGVAGDGATARHNQSRQNLAAIQAAKPAQNQAADAANKRFTDDQGNAGLVQPGN